MLILSLVIDFLFLGGDHYSEFQSARPETAAKTPK